MGSVSEIRPTKESTNYDNNNKLSVSVEAKSVRDNVHSHNIWNGAAKHEVSCEAAHVLNTYNLCEAWHLKLCSCVF